MFRPFHSVALCERDKAPLSAAFYPLRNMSALFSILLRGC